MAYSLRGRSTVKNLSIRTITLAALAGSALRAQDITGTWQGTLQAGRELRTVIRISKTDGGALKALLYSIDQGGQGLPSAPVVLQGPSVN